MRVVSLVPSLTETLVQAGVDVVGRTRFCIHPRQLVQGIPAVGGTKDLDWQKLKPLRPDLLILDQEENLKWMQEESPCDVLVSHVTSIESMAKFSQELAQRLPEKLILKDYALRWQRVVEAPAVPWRWGNIPGAIESWVAEVPPEMDEILYLIWRKPWMKAGSDTFIQSVFEKLGAKTYRPATDKRYPTLEESELAHKNKVCLFSSEPYPFEKEMIALKKMTPGRGAIVEGEFYSWFGVRSLEFLERHLGLN